MQKSYKGTSCLLTLVRDIRSENLSAVNKLYYVPGHDLISGQEVALGRFPLIFLTGALSLNNPSCLEVSKKNVEIETKARIT